MSETVELRLYSPLQIDIINRDAPGRAIPFQAVSYHCRSEYTRIMLIDQARAVPKLCAKYMEANDLARLIGQRNDTWNVTSPEIQAARATAQKSKKVKKERGDVR